MSFREMRRKAQQLSEEECLCLLEAGRTAVLALHTDTGWPYAVPVNYVFHEGAIFFHGAKTGLKADALRNDERVSLCVIVQDELRSEELTTCFRSVIIFGRARILEQDDEIRDAAMALGLRFCPDGEKVEEEIRREWPALCCVKITIDHMSGKEAIELTRMRRRDQGGTTGFI